MHADINFNILRGIEPFTNKRHKSNNIECLSAFLTQNIVVNQATFKQGLLETSKVLQFATMFNNGHIIIASMIISTPQKR
jgi:hypothetical protein